MGNNPNEKPNASPQASMPDAESTNLLMAILSYLGPLVIVSYIVAKGDSFVKFHIKQGLVLFVIEIAAWFITLLLPMLVLLLQLVNLAVLILAIIGIVHAAQKKETPLPFVGSYSKYFPI